MRYILIFILFVSCTKTEIVEIAKNLEIEGIEKTIYPEDLGANPANPDDDWAALQAAIDSAVKVNGKVILKKGTYNISKPLMVYNWNPTANLYAQAFCKIEGESTMWDRGGGTKIKANFKDGFALGIQQGKGVIVSGINFEGLYTPPAISMDSFYRTKLSEYGDPTIPWDRYGPYAAIVVDPFSGIRPTWEPENGYTNMMEWYRGAQTRSGSTGCRFEDLTFAKFDVGACTSPNGYTQNAEILTFENIRVQNCRIGFSGSQAQEKLNRIINVGAWGVTHTLFTWTLTGVGHPGHWVVDGVNVAGQVANLMYRPSASWFPLIVENVFAESLGSIGYWYGGAGDAINNSVINFVYPDQVRAYHFSFAPVKDIVFNNVNLRIYGQITTPMTFFNPANDIKLNNVEQYVPPVWGRLPGLVDSVDMGAYTLHRGGFSPVYFRDGSNIKATIPMNRYPSMKVGDIAIIVSSGNMDILGMCRVSEVQANSFTVEWISNLLNQAQQNTFYIYRKK